MAEPLETNSLELRIAFHNAVSRFQDWTANVAEPRVKLRGKFCPISEVCQEATTLPNPSPNAILSILYKIAHAGDDILALKMEPIAGPDGICCGSLRSAKTRSVAESTAIVTTLLKDRLIQ